MKTKQKKKVDLLLKCSLYFKNLENKKILKYNNKNVSFLLTS